MKVYRIRHKPTGLFFKPSRHGSKVNLSKDGRLYTRKPPLNGYLGGDYHHPNPAKRQGFERRPINFDDWEIVVYRVEEEQTLDS